MHARTFGNKILTTVTNLLPPPGGIAIRRVCLLVRSFVNMASELISWKQNSNVHEIWRGCSASAHCWPLRGQGQTSRSKPPYWNLLLAIQQNKWFPDEIWKSTKFKMAACMAVCTHWVFFLVYVLFNCSLHRAKVLGHNISFIVSLGYVPTHFRQPNLFFSGAVTP